MKGVDSFGKSMDSFDKSFSSDIQKSNKTRKSESKKNQDNVNKLFGKSKNTKIWSVQNYF